jgi:hypothetical protein
VTFRDAERRFGQSQHSAWTQNAHDRRLTARRTFDKSGVFRNALILAMVTNDTPCVRPA